MTRREWRAQEALRLESMSGGEDEQTVAVTGSTEPVLELGPIAAAATHPPTPAHGVAAVPVHTPGSGLIVDIRDGHVPKARPSIRPGEQGRFVTRGSARPAPPLGEISHRSGAPVVTGGTPAQPQVLERAIEDGDDDDEVDTMFLATAGVVATTPVLEPSQTQASMLLRADAQVDAGVAADVQESPASSSWAPPSSWDAAQADLAKPVLLPSDHDGRLPGSPSGGIDLPPPAGGSLLTGPISDEPLIPAVSRNCEPDVGELPPPVGELPVATGFHTSTDTGSNDYLSTSTTSDQSRPGPVSPGNTQAGRNVAPLNGYTGSPRLIEPRLTSLAVDDDDETAVVGGSAATTGESEAPPGSLPRSETSLHDFADATERRLRAEQRKLISEDPGVRVGAYQPLALRPHWTFPVAAGLACLGVVCVVVAVMIPASSVWMRVLPAVIALICLAGACRLPFVRVFLAPDALHAHSFWSSVTVFRVGVVRATSVDETSPLLGKCLMPQLRLANDETIKLKPLTEMTAGPLSLASRPASVQEHVNEINAWLIARGHTEAIAVVGQR